MEIRGVKPSRLAEGMNGKVMSRLVFRQLSDGVGKKITVLFCFCCCDKIYSGKSDIREKSFYSSDSSKSRSIMAVKSEHQGLKQLVSLCGQSRTDQ